LIGIEYVKKSHLENQKNFDFFRLYVAVNLGNVSFRTDTIYASLLKVFRYVISIGIILYGDKIIALIIERNGKEI
jgi:hypothetical protein